MTKIGATFWDCGGVFLTNGWDEHARQRVVENFRLNFDEFEKLHTQANDLWERGTIDIHEYLQETVFYQPRTFSEDEFICQMQAVSQVLYPAMMDFVGKLRAQRTPEDGVEMYLLSNESRDLMEYRIPTFSLGGMFDGYVVSAFVGLRKPEAAFFRCALDFAQQEPDACVFIDDREENVAAARKQGMHGIRLESPKQAIAELGKLGVTVK